MYSTMKEVREEIDLIDKELVLILAKRQKCIELAALIKNDKNKIIDKERIEDVINKVKSFSGECGLSLDIAEPLWRKLISLSIDHEFEEFSIISNNNN